MTVPGADNRVAELADAEGKGILSIVLGSVNATVTT
jgi:hypothetical protein